MVCVICNPNSFRSFIFKLSLMIVRILKMCTFNFVHISLFFFIFWSLKLRHADRFLVCVLCNSNSFFLLLHKTTFGEPLGVPDIKPTHYLKPTRWNWFIPRKATKKFLFINIQICIMIHNEHVQLLFCSHLINIFLFFRSLGLRYFIHPKCLGVSGLCNL